MARIIENNSYHGMELNSTSDEESANELGELLTDICAAVADQEVHVSTVFVEGFVCLIIVPNDPATVGFLVGKQGRMIESLKTIMVSAGARLGLNVKVELNTSKLG